MEKIDISRFISDVKKVVAGHYLGNGEYCRWLWQNEKCDRELGCNEYGCADAANILYTIDEFVFTDEERSARIAALRALQDPETGLFKEKTHHTIHTTAHCTAALELFDALPLYPITGLHKYYDKNELYALLDGLDWKCNPWNNSHQGAGVYAALVNADEASAEWREMYFEWFKENADEHSGFWKKGITDETPWWTDDRYKTGAAMFEYMAGGFHYLFNHEHAHQPIPYPEKMIDTCLELYERDAFNGKFANGDMNFVEIDWLYSINRARRQTPTHRVCEVQAAIEDFAKRYTDAILERDPKTDDTINDLHLLFGGMCALAELQAALPGKIATEKPLRLVLDRRPFI